MKKYILTLLLPFTLICCKNDDNLIKEVIQEICLNEITINESNESCESAFINQGCEVIHIGSKSLSDNIKSDFVDFCNFLGSELTFVSSNGNLTIGIIQKREFNTGTAVISTGFNTPNCVNYCLENEEALIELRSDRFSLRLVVNTGLNFGIDSTNASEEVVSGFTIWSVYENTRQVIFQIDVENYFDEPILPDTTYARYHNNVTLNNTNYTELYSNENNNANGLVRKEKVYFHPKNGLIAVRDSLGVLWVRN